jgi:hypothetical protein
MFTNQSLLAKNSDYILIIKQSCTGGIIQYNCKQHLIFFFNTKIKINMMEHIIIEQLSLTRKFRVKSLKKVPGKKKKNTDSSQSHVSICTNTEY